jgi:hypothetical protein
MRTKKEPSKGGKSVFHSFKTEEKPAYFHLYFSPYQEKRRLIHQRDFLVERRPQLVKVITLKFYFDWEEAESHANVSIAKTSEYLLGLSREDKKKWLEMQDKDLWQILLRCARNTCLDTIRKNPRGVVRQFVEDGASEMESLSCPNSMVPFDTIDYEAYMEILYKIAKINQLDREILNLHDEGYSLVDIAQVLGMTPTTVVNRRLRAKGRILRASKKLDT